MYHKIQHKEYTFEWQYVSKSGMDIKLLVYIKKIHNTFNILPTKTYNAIK